MNGVETQNLASLRFSPQAFICPCFTRTPPHHSIIPTFHHSRCERSEPTFFVGIFYTNCRILPILEQNYPYETFLPLGCTGRNDFTRHFGTCLLTAKSFLCHNIGRSFDSVNIKWSLTFTGVGGTCFAPVKRRKKEHKNE